MFPLMAMVPFVVPTLPDWIEKLADAPPLWPTMVAALSKIFRALSACCAQTPIVRAANSIQNKIRFILFVSCCYLFSLWSKSTKCFVAVLHPA